MRGCLTALALLVLVAGVAAAASYVTLTVCGCTGGR
jgi:hypothetical protein